jgi:hypothetical protein
MIIVVGMVEERVWKPAHWHPTKVRGTIGYASGQSRARATASSILRMNVAANCVEISPYQACAVRMSFAASGRTITCRIIHPAVISSTLPTALLRRVRLEACQRRSSSSFCASVSGNASGCWITLSQSCCASSMRSAAGNSKISGGTRLIELSFYRPGLLAGGPRGRRDASRSAGETPALRLAGNIVPVSKRSSDPTGS